MSGLMRLVAILVIVLALQVGQSSKAMADGCVVCDDPCSGCVLDPNDLTWE
jgi:hypothetical protein